MEMSKGKRNFLVVFLSMLVGMIYFIPYIRFTFYDQTMVALAIDNTQLGTLGSVYGTVAIFCYIVGGILAQKVNLRWLLTISLAGTALATFWQAAFPSFGSLIVIFVLYAIFTTATLWSPYLTYMRSFGTDEEQGRLFGVSEAMRGAISAVMGFFFIWLFSLYADQVGGYRMMLIIGAIIYLVCAVLAFILLPNYRAKEKFEAAQQAEGGKGKGAVAAALKLPGVWLTGFFIFFCYLIIAGGSNYFGTYTTTILGVDASVSSGLQILRVYILSIFLGIIGGIIADKFHYRARFLMIPVAVAGICCFLMPALKSYILVAIVVSVVISGMNYTFKSTYYSIMNEALIPRPLTGTATGVISFIAYIPDAFLTIIVGIWLDADLVSGFNKLFILMGISAVAAVGIAVIMNRRYIKAEKSGALEGLDI